MFIPAAPISGAAEARVPHQPPLLALDQWKPCSITEGSPAKALEQKNREKASKNFKIHPSYN